MITRAAQSDAPGLITCINAAYAAYRAQGIPLPPVSDGIVEDIADHHVWITRDGSTITGGLILSIDGTEAYLKNIAVHPDHGGRGIGGALIKTALDAARDAGCTVIKLTTHAGIPQNIALYEHLGWYVTATAGDKVAMERPL